jgi:Uma2 family endonuclease
MAPPPPIARVVVAYDVPRARPDWTLSEEPVPESQPHDLTLDLLKAILLAWVARSRRDAQIARNLAVRWIEARPQIGMDPDLCLIEPSTPDKDELESLCTWMPRQSPPRLAIEVVSSRATKDYEQSPDKCAACGVEELWIFDAKLRGPRRLGGPYKLQIWRRVDEDFRRVYAGDGPARSEVLGAWVFVVADGERIRIADDAEGERWWPTGQEEERAEKERERAEKEAALRRVAALEEELRRRGG